ncbi:hypothetical protein CURTO8I2_210018 [Curtobacterium sp. 8I-2]|nr:hypothetical protein CURTO8I2_210018 [Curtobacterium sp. 8I-2]
MVDENDQSSNSTKSIQRANPVGKLFHSARAYNSPSSNASTKLTDFPISRSWGSGQTKPNDARKRPSGPQME